MDDVQGILARSALFRGVPTGLLSEVSSTSEARLLGRDEVLLAADRRSDKLHIVLSGGLRVQPDDDTPAPAPIGPGECVGLSSLIEGRPSGATVLADESTIVLSLDREQVWQLVEASPELARNVLRAMAGRVAPIELLPGQSSRLKRYFERTATVDSLTGLHNRRWLEDALPRQMARAQRSQQPLSLLMVDIDRLKPINDRFGHLTGDAVLGRVSQLLMSGVRPQDLLARFGGEEFAVVLPAADLEGAVTVAGRLRAAVEANTRDDDSQDVPSTTVSIGVAAMAPGDRLDDLVARSERALSRAKATGRNRVQS